MTNFLSVRSCFIIYLLRRIAFVQLLFAFCFQTSILGCVFQEVLCICNCSTTIPCTPIMDVQFKEIFKLFNYLNIKEVTYLVSFLFFSPFLLLKNKESSAFSFVKLPHIPYSSLLLVWECMLSGQRNSQDNVGNNTLGIFKLVAKFPLMLVGCIFHSVALKNTTLFSEESGSLQIVTQQY